MIALLVYSTNLYASNPTDYLNLSTGELVIPEDSVLISYNDLRIVNSKLIQLDYEQQINANLRTIIKNDSIIIKDYQVLNDRINKNRKKAVRQRNIAIGSGVLFFISSISFLLISSIFLSISHLPSLPFLT